MSRAKARAAVPPKTARRPAPEPDAGEPRPLRSFVFADLAVSPLNVRTNQEDADATEVLEASIAENGLLQPLSVHPLPEAYGRYGVFAGGRRLRAIGRLIEAGRLPADWPIACIVRDDLSDAAITELSLAENFVRRDLRPYEIHAAVVRAHAQGASAEDIAGQLGQRVVWVRQQLRLGGLDPAIFAAYADGEVSIEDARAYAATEDQALQRAAFKRFGKSDGYSREREIRAFLKVGDRELERLLKFVGDEAYRAAGGRFELDLFADGPDRGRVVDEGTLRELAEAKLHGERDRVRGLVERSDLRFVAEPPQLPGARCSDLALEIGRAELPEPFGRARRRAGLELLSHDVVATLTIRDDGSIEERFWWASRKAKREAEKAAAGSPDASAPPADTRARAHVVPDAGLTPTTDYVGAQAARAAVRDEHGLSADGLHVVRSLRREILRALLVTDADGGGTLGRDYLVWTQLRHELSKDRDTATGARHLAGESWSVQDRGPIGLEADWLADDAGGAGEAHRLWAEAVAQVAAHPAFALPDPVEGFAAFDQADDRFRARAGAVLAGIALLRSANVAGWRIPAHDKLAALACGHDEIVRELWRPTPAFLGLFGKMKRLELVRDADAADLATTTRWSKLKDRDLGEACATALAALPAWVHPLLSFGMGGGDEPNEDALPPAEDEPSGDEPAPTLDVAA